MHNSCLAPWSGSWYVTLSNVCPSSLCNSRCSKGRNTLVLQQLWRTMFFWSFPSLPCVFAAKRPYTYASRISHLMTLFNLSCHYSNPGPVNAHGWKQPRACLLFTKDSVILLFQNLLKHSVLWMKSRELCGILVFLMNEFRFPVSYLRMNMGWSGFIGRYMSKRLPQPSDVVTTVFILTHRKLKAQMGTPPVQGHPWH